MVHGSFAIYSSQSTYFAASVIPTIDSPPLSIHLFILSVIQYFVPAGASLAGMNLILNLHCLISKCLGFFF